MTMASGLFMLTFRDALDTSAEPVDFLADSFKMELVTDTYTPDFSTHDAEGDITNEVAGTNYTAGGNVIDSTTFAVASGNLTFDSADEAWANVTISAVRGRVIYDDTPTTPVADPLICATTFGADFAATAGTFTVQESASGIFVIDGVP